MSHHFIYISVYICDSTEKPFLHCWIPVSTLWAGNFYLSWSLHTNLWSNNKGVTEVNVVESFIVKSILWFSLRLRLYLLLLDKSAALSGSADVSVHEQFLKELHKKICMNMSFKVDLVSLNSNKLILWTNISMTLNQERSHRKPPCASIL